MKRVFVFALMVGWSVSGEPGAGHELAGRVLDPSAAAVSGAEVRLYSRTGGAKWSAVSNARGEYRFENVAAGEYLMEARTQGFDQASPMAVRVPASQVVDLKLEIKALASRVVVTGSASALAAIEAAKALDVVDAGEMERRAEMTVSEALRATPGVRVQQLGGPGAFARVLVRGLRAADTGILMDGVRLRDSASVQGDATAFVGDLQLVDTERIEVLRGLGSSIYGSNATAGVVNLVSHEGAGRLRGELTGEGGGLGVARGVARISGGNRVSYSAGYGRLDVNGGVDGVESVRNDTAQGSLLVRPTSTTSLSARVWAAFADVGVNSSPMAGPVGNLPAAGAIRAIGLDDAQARLGDAGQAFAWGNATFGPNFLDPDSVRKGRFSTTQLQWTQQAGGRVNYRVSYQNTASHRDNVNGPKGQGYQPSFNSSSVFAGRIDVVQARVDAMLAKWNTLSAGYEYEREYFENPSTDENPDALSRVNARSAARQRSNAVFVHDQARLLGDRLQVALTGRAQGFSLSKPEFQGGAAQYAGADFKAAPTAYTGDAAISYYLPGTMTKLRAHAGNGFRSPTLYERIGTSFFWGEFSPLGDPRLRPERTVSFDAGFDQYFANSKYRVAGSYFYTRLQEVIGYASLMDDIYGRWGGYVNTGGGLARGVEITGEARPHRTLMVRGSYTYTNADERQSALVGGSLRSIRVLPQAVSFVATQQIGRRWTATADFLGGSEYVSGSFFVGSGNRPYVFEGPRKLDASLSYALPVGEERVLRFYTRVENVLNRRYWEDGFRTPRIWATGGVRFQF